MNKLLKTSYYKKNEFQNSLRIYFLIPEEEVSISTQSEKNIVQSAINTLQNEKCTNFDKKSQKSEKVYSDEFVIKKVLPNAKITEIEKIRIAGSHPIFSELFGKKEDENINIIYVDKLDSMGQTISGHNIKTTRNMYAKIVVRDIYRSKNKEKWKKRKKKIERRH